MHGPAGEKYERTMAAMGLPSLEPLVVKLGAPGGGAHQGGGPRLLEVGGVGRARGWGGRVGQLSPPCRVGWGAPPPPPTPLAPLPPLPPGLQVLQLEVNGRAVMFVADVDRQRLAA